MQNGGIIEPRHLQKHTNGTDWWWHLRLAMCLYQLSLFKEAIAQHEKSMAICSMDETALHLSKCHLRLDQPLLAAQMFKQMAMHNPGAPLLHVIDHSKLMSVLPCFRRISVARIAAV